MTAARRLAAILAADVVGYSRLMGEDEAGTARIVRERREAAAPIVAAHGGRVFKTMGDGILIEFASLSPQSNVRSPCRNKRPSATRRLPRRKARLPNWRSSRRRAGRRRGRAGRRGQYRDAAGGHRRAGRSLCFGVDLRSCARQGQGRVHRSRREGAEEHRAAGAGLRS